MNALVRLIGISWFLLLSQTIFSQKIEFGLISQLDLPNFTIVGNSKRDELVLHNSIDLFTRTKSYFSKSLIAKGEKIHISLQTTLPIDSYLRPIKSYKLKYKNVSYWLYKRIHFVSLEFTFNNKNVTRIIYQEPNLTTVIVLDYFYDLPSSKLNVKQIIKCLTFRTSV
jgi:hypothetical protein